MAPLYVHCPYCAFPVVIPAVEREVPRVCRQCRRQYLPHLEEEPKPKPVPQRARSAGGGAGTKRPRRRLALRALLQPRQRRAE